MTLFKKIILSIIVFVSILSIAFIATTSVKATDVATSDTIKITGAEIRRNGNAGIRFVGKIDGYTAPDGRTVTNYGIVLAFGEAIINNTLVKDGTANDYNILSAEVDELDNDNNFYITLINIPSSAYTQLFTARAYVVLDNGDIVYGAEGKIRSLAQVVVVAYDGGIEGQIITDVYATIDRPVVVQNDLDVIADAKANILVNESFNPAKENVLIAKAGAPIEDYKFYKYGTNAFKDLDAGVTGASAKNVIYLFAGSYSKNSIIGKQLTIVGPNYGINIGNGASQARKDEAQVDFNNITIGTSNLVIDGIKIYDTDTYAKNNTQFKCGQSTKTVTFRNVYFYSLANIMRYTNVGTQPTNAGGVFTIENSRLEDLSQFVIYAAATYADTLTKVNFVGNYCCGNGFGSMAGLGMIRIQGGDNIQIKVLNNYFAKSPSATTLFRCQIGSFEVKYNTFKNITSFNDSNSTVNIYYEQNLYLNSSGNPVSEVPAQVSANYGVADKANSLTEESRAKAYSDYVANVKGTITYNTNGGNSIENQEYVQGLVVNLATPTKDGCVFAGWTNTNDANDTTYVTSRDTISYTGAKTLYAKWLTEPVELSVSNNDAAAINSLNPDIIVRSDFSPNVYELVNANLNAEYNTKQFTYGIDAFSSLTDAFGSLSTNGKKIYVFGGTYNTTATLPYGAIVKGNGVDVVNVTSQIGVNSNVSGVTFEKIKFTNTISFAGVASNIVINECDFTGSTGMINFVGNATNIEISNCVGSFSATRPFKFDGNGTNISFIDNTFSGTYTIGGDDKWATGVCDFIRFYGALKGITFTGNTISNAAQTIIYAVKTEAGDFTFKNNVFSDYYKACIDLREPQNVVAGQKFNYIIEHNVFKDANVGWSSIRLRCNSVAAADYSVVANYNVFKNLSNYTEIFERAGGTLTGFANFDKNYCDQTLQETFFTTNTATHNSWYDTEEELEAAYLVYLAE